MSSRRENWELERRLQTACLLIITAILCAIAAYWMRAVLIPFVLAFFLFQLLEPMVRVLERRRLPHALAVTLTLVFVGFCAFYTSTVVTNSVGGIIKSSDTYTNRISDLLESLWNKYPAFEERFKAISQQQIQKLSEGIGSFIAALTNSVIYLISQSTVVLLFLMFLLFGSKQEDELTGVLAVIDEKIKNYILVKTGLSLFTGFMVGLLLHLLGVDLAFVFGLMAVLLNFIPNVGSILATLLPLPVILVSPTMTTAEATLAILLPGTIQFLIGNLLEPKLLGDSLNLSPVVILFSLTVWTALWGGIGALLAVPITAIIQILCDQLEFTRPVAAVLRGDIIALMSAYKKLEVPEDETPKKKKKSIPKGTQEAQIDQTYEDIKKVQKTL
ncbi:MAG: AI-2E family transporter [Candidatus Eremiobacteraeota bacterium]|nr:AI-2E family transporter [Candidatus Eremiobacteraeota bacterium]